MRIQLSASVISLLVTIGCSPAEIEPPSGPVARFGTSPTIDGVFEDGEWDDAETVQAGTTGRFRIKHDNVNLYFALDVGGGELWLDADPGVRVLHWSAQLGSADYTKSDTSTQILDRAFAYELWGLQDQSPAVIRETLAGYLAENGWVASLASMGDLMQSEVAVSFDLLGVSTGSARFVEIPGVHLHGALVMSRTDPRAEEIMALASEERRRRYPAMFWPAESESLGMGPLQDTLRADPARFGRIWIDLGNPVAAEGVDGSD